MSHDAQTWAEESKLPSPRRLARRSVRLLRRFGLSEFDALTTVIAITNRMDHNHESVRNYSPAWTQAIRSECRNQLARHYSRYRRGQPTSAPNAGDSSPWPR